MAFCAKLIIIRRALGGGGILHSLFVAYQEAIARYGATEAVLQHSVPSYVSFHGLFGDTFSLFCSFLGSK
jgi:hypothetical protein